MATCARCNASGVFIVLARVPEGTLNSDEILYHARCTVCEEEWVE